VTRTVRHYLPLTLTLLVIFLDRLTKVIVSHTMQLHESIPFLGDTIRWTYIRNDSMALGISLIHSRTLGVLSLIAVVIVAWIFVRMKDQSGGIRWILAAILGGAVGNTYDRLLNGYVIDFIDVDLPNFIMNRFAVFNVADSAVSVGVTILILVLFFQKQPGGLPQPGDLEMRIESEPPPAAAEPAPDVNPEAGRANETSNPEQA